MRTEKNFGKGRLAKVWWSATRPALPRASWPASTQSGCGRIRAPPWCRDALPRLCSSGVARARALAPRRLRLCACCYHERVRTRPELEEENKIKKGSASSSSCHPGPLGGKRRCPRPPGELWWKRGSLHHRAAAAAAAAARATGRGLVEQGTSFLRLPRGGLAPTPHGSGPLECSFY